MSSWQLILHQQTKATYLAVIFLTTCSFCLGVPCQSDSWWDSVQDKCVKCTQCEDQLIVLRPCQLHQDTICGTINDLHIDWMLLSQTEPYMKERQKEFETIETEILWNWQSTCLILAALACLFFFLVAVYVSLQHLMHWRRMEQRLDRDIEELSARLMTRLAESRHVENGSFLIENPIKDQHARPVEVHCIYLERLSRNEPVKSFATENLYTEEVVSKR